MDGGPRQQIGAPEAGPRAGKAPNDNAIRAAGYGAVWHGQKSWNGVAILARGGEPMETRRGLPGDPDDTHSRYIEAAIVDPLLGCLYMPNGNPPPGPLNSRYFRPVRRKETRARRWDLQFESTSLQRRSRVRTRFQDHGWRRRARIQDRGMVRLSALAVLSGPCWPRRPRRTRAGRPGRTPRTLRPFRPVRARRPDYDLVNLLL